MVNFFFVSIEEMKYLKGYLVLFSFMIVFLSLYFVVVEFVFVLSSEKVILYIFWVFILFFIEVLMC